MSTQDSTLSGWGPVERACDGAVHERSGVPVAELVVTGGVLNNALSTQVYADVTDGPVSSLDPDQGPAKGCARRGGLRRLPRHIEAIASAMTEIRREAYPPGPVAAEAYEALCSAHEPLRHDASQGGKGVMRRLKRIRREAVAR